MAAGFPGPLVAMILITYRLYGAFRTKIKTGSYVDKENSNYWCKQKINNEEP